VTDKPPVKKQPRDVTKYRYKDALFSPKHVVCAVRLRPMCLGHILLLQAINSPYITSTENTDSSAEDLYLAVLICGMSFEDGERFIKDDKFYQKLKRQFEKTLIKDIKSKDKWSYKVENVKFQNYLKYYLLSMPKYETLFESKGLTSGMDWIAGTVTLFKKQNTESEVLNMSLVKLFYEQCSMFEAEGGIRVQNVGDKVSEIIITKKGEPIPHYGHTS